MLWLLSIFINNLPKSNWISVFELDRFSKLEATAVAQAAVPQDFVNPAPLSQTLTLIKLLLIFFAKVILHLSGNKLWFSIFGPIFSKSKLSIFSKKKNYMWISNIYSNSTEKFFIFFVN